MTFFHMTLIPMIYERSCDLKMASLFYQQWWSFAAKDKTVFFLTSYYIMSVIHGGEEVTEVILK